MNLWDRLMLSELLAANTEISANALVRSLTPGGLPVQALGRYAGPLGRAISELKYRDATALAGPLARLLAHKLALPQAPLLVPVPLHPVRLAERGFNQTALLARALGRARKWNVAFGLLTRCRQTRTQARLGRSERLVNLEQAFVCHAGQRPSLPGPLVLIDDVVTTGTTVDACARALSRINLPVEAVVALAIAN